MTRKQKILINEFVEQNKLGINRVKYYKKNLILWFNNSKRPFAFRGFIKNSNSNIILDTSAQVILDKLVEELESA